MMYQKTGMKENLKAISQGIDSLTEELLYCYEELDFIYESGEILSSIAKGDFKEWKKVSDTFLDISLEVFGADIGWVFFVEEDEEGIDIEAVRGIESKKAKEISLPFLDQVEKGVVLVDFSQEMSCGGNKNDDLFSFILAPFTSSEKFLGAIVLGKKGTANFNSSHVKLASHFSTYFSHVFENARMFQEINEAYQVSEKANKELKKLDQMKENFILATSHELKTPLTIIITSMEILESCSDMKGIPKELIEMVGFLQAGVKRLDRVVRNVCEVSKVAHGKFLLEKKRFKPIHIVNDIVIETELIFKGRNISLHRELDHTTWAFGDANMIKHLMTELLLNAIKHTPDGGVIELVIEKDNAGTVVKVIDGGKGVTQKEKKDIFQKFHAIGNRMQHSSGLFEYKSSGIGVGLAISKEIIEAHEGRIWVDSPAVDAKFAKGCCFSFFIPDKQD